MFRSQDIQLLVIISHSMIYIFLQRSTVQKHSGVYLDEKLNCNTHITKK